MKLYKSLSFVSIILIASAIFYLQLSKKPSTYNDPLSSRNNFLNQFNHALNLAKIKSNNIIVRDFQNEIEFNINSTKVILSLQKDPYWQIASLQEILKIAKMKDKDVKLIDLSINHPYATI